MLETQELSPHEVKKKKKGTRQWEAWTHEEEERFFLALRQVGKNFEKITIDVKSKNKDQVRHYYYRLIKRLNKLLSSEFALDANNSTDVHAAMLSWWSLLEKHKCSSVKLHLKPKRQKTLVSALEQQLLRDRKKAKKKPIKAAEEQLATPGTRKRSYKKPNPEPSAPQASDVSNEMRGHESPLIELATPQPQGSEPPGAEAPLGVNAAAATAPEPASDAGNEMLLPPKAPASSDKIKLQLFPVDDATRVSLERDGHNPHLLLTLKGSKSIASVLQHLLQKWGSSSIASGELRLYPFVAEADDRSWSSRDSNLSAAEVYHAVGKPSIFRLRYGWSPVSGARVSEAKPQQEAQEIVQSQTLGCSWLYEKSTDGFGRRLWRDAVPSNEGNASTLDWVANLTMNVNVNVNVSVSQLFRDASKQGAAAAPEAVSHSIWGGEDACDAFEFRKKEKLQEVIMVPMEKPQEPFVEPKGKLLDAFVSERLREHDEDVADGDDDDHHHLMLGSSQVISTDAPRSSALDLYWADSLGALDGAAVQSQNMLLNSNSSLGVGAFGSLFPDSLDGFPR